MPISLLCSWDNKHACPPPRTRHLKQWIVLFSVPAQIFWLVPGVLGPRMKTAVMCRSHKDRETLKAIYRTDARTHLALEGRKACKEKYYGNQSWISNHAWWCRRLRCGAGTRLGTAAWRCATSTPACPGPTTTGTTRASTPASPSWMTTATVSHSYYLTLITCMCNCTTGLQPLVHALPMQRNRRLKNFWSAIP